MQPTGTEAREWPKPVTPFYIYRRVPIYRTQHGHNLALYAFIYNRYELNFMDLHDAVVGVERWRGLR